ncbi:uncharacterized protein A4U43_C05F29930 [Asparagus officinalis]|uniref:Uncharacterized protein n=1 Tax=Asparagus officinalis TaxID=4686 RepID=A0A5P1F0X3_ASPOF|nr:uncharacterized protein A4U43_C05F29930 [Asparagus officinalis]
MSEELVKLTNNVISRMTMSRTCSGGDSDAEEVQKIVQEATELVGKFKLANHIGFCKNMDFQGFDKRMEDWLKRFDKMMEAILKEKEEERRKETNIAKEEQKIFLI